MLTWEFYSLNATTMLLWLLQNIDHEVLLCLVVLGAVCVLVSALVIACRLARIILSIPMFLCIHLLNLFIYVIKRLILRVEPSQLPETFPSVNTELPIDDEVFRQLSLSTNPVAARLMGPTSRPSLSLPQTLALHSNQWNELEASRSTSQTRELPTRLADSTIDAEVEGPLLRRSARIRRRRARVCRSGACSS